MSEHDPLTRQMPTEPRFVLLARDPSAAELVRLWFALRKRDRSLCDAIYKRLLGIMADLPFQPTKDAQHILSAQKVSNEMDCWLMQEKARLKEPAR